jgi:DMSO/TMAO reductase YedYZ molybdopterin-dependent catalytic subunit
MKSLMFSRREFLAAAVMIVRASRPEDLEMPAAGFLEYITPVDQFFVRSHVVVPKVEIAAWRLHIDGQVSNPLTLTMEDLRRMPSFEVISVLECAGNGRAFYDPPVAGIQWANGAVGNGRWRGVRLADLLRRAGARADAVEVLFDGEDVPIGSMPDFQRSIPFKKALHPDTLLAYSMNGETLPVKHGFPLRAVVPGWAGDSWAKWIKSVRVLNEESKGFWMANAYRHPGKAVEPGSAVAPEAMQPVTSLRIKSVIATPSTGDRLEAGKRVVVRGAVWSGDQSPVAGVDVSVDGGQSWRPAQLAGRETPFGWRLWQFTWTPASNDHYVVMSRARDRSGNMQPMSQEWNPSGYLWNAVTRVEVNMAPPLQRAAVSMEDAPASLRAACLTCHGEDMVVQQRLTRAQWDRELSKMIGWGARVSPADRESFLDYLTVLSTKSKLP